MGPEETTAVSIADADGDGLQDVIFTNQLAESLSIWWGRRGEMPRERVDVHIGRSSSPARVGDVDGDGRSDIVVALPDAAALGILRGTPDARRFMDVETVFQGPAPHSPVLLDWNADGRSDVLFSEALDPYQAEARTSDGQTWLPHILLGSAIGMPLLALDAHRLITAREGRLMRVELDAWGSLVHRNELGYSQEWSPLGVVQQELIVGLKSGELHRLSESGRRPCRLGDLPADFGRWSATADLDGDGTLDAVSFASCRGCTSNHVFARGLVAITR
jgi:hypothetical protein